MKRVITMLAIAGLCSTGAVLAAQAPAPAAPAKKEAAKKADDATKPPKADKMAKDTKMAPAYTGCVAEGTKKGSYVLNDATSGGTDKANYDLKGGSLKAHVGHKVEVSGTVTKPATGNSVLAVKKVKMVAPSCA